MGCQDLIQSASNSPGQKRCMGRWAGRVKWAGVPGRVRRWIFLGKDYGCPRRAKPSWMQVDLPHPIQAHLTPPPPKSKEGVGSASASQRSPASRHTSFFSDTALHSICFPYDVSYSTSEKNELNTPCSSMATQTYSRDRAVVHGASTKAQSSGQSP